MLKKTLLLAVGLLSGTLSACGGGGSGGSSESGGGGGSSQGPSFALSSSTGNAIIAADDTVTVFTSSVSITGTLPTNAYPDFVHDNTVISAATASASGTTFDIKLTTKAGLAEGEYTGTTTFRLCSETPCVNVIRGSSLTYSHRLTVTAADWSTFQGNARHTGHVPINLNPVNFTKAWEWSEPLSANHFVNPVVTGAGKVYITIDSNFQGFAYALDESNGNQLWHHDFYQNVGTGGAIRGGGSPTYYQGQLLIPQFVDFVFNSIVEQTGIVWRADPLTGTVRAYSRFEAQSANLFAPTAFQTGLYLSAGQYGGQVYASSTLARGDSSGEITNSWVSSYVPNYAWYAQSPAVDEKYVYYYTGEALNAYNVSNGTLAFSISDPEAISTNYRYNGAPIIGSNGHILAYSGMPPSNAATLYTGGMRKLVSYDTVNKSIAWRSAQAYLTTPAVAGGLIYVGRSYPAVFEALSETNGSVLWSWSPPSGESVLFGNVIVTNNLAFVSSDKNIYAIDLATHQTVWTYPAAGALALSAKGNLYITAGNHANQYGTQISDGRVIAIQLR